MNTRVLFIRLKSTAAAACLQQSQQSLRSLSRSQSSEYLDEDLLQHQLIG